MATQLKGKIIWVQDDFAYIGGISPKKDSTHTVARIENAVITDYMIKFYVCPHKFTDDEEWSYNVNLLINDSGTRFNGTFSEATEPSYKGDVHAELFMNEKGYLLQGRWIENEVLFNFWATIHKEG